MKAIAATLLVLILVGCVAPPPATPYAAPAASATYIASQRSDALKLHDHLAAARDRRKVATVQDEVAKLDDEIESLEARLIEVERRISQAEASSYAPAATSSSGTGPVYTGRRGGRYTISPSGKKVYQKRR